MGLVTFGNRASTVAPLTKITSQIVREQLVNQLPISAGGPSSIGSGLLEGVGVTDNI